MAKGISGMQKNTLIQLPSRPSPLRNISNFGRVVIAEFRKQQKEKYRNRSALLMNLIWPFLSFLAAYYMFLPFVDSKADASGPSMNYLEGSSLILFVLTGFLGYTTFTNLVQSAWMTAYERVEGTLNLMFLSPASRRAILLGNASANFVEGVWMFLTLYVLALAVYGHDLSVNFMNLAGVLFLLAFLAIGWGCLLNAFFLMTRDASLFFILLQSPMSFLSGVRIPLAAFPLWLKSLSYFLPLTYVLTIFRGIVLDSKSLWELKAQYGIALLIGIFLFMIAFYLVGLVERIAKKRGTFFVF